MSLWQHQDLYCERLSPDLLAEPLNATTNLAFLLAALWVRPRSPLGAWLLVSIGLGSALFHTLARTWSMAADVIPIGVFVAIALHRTARVHLQLTWGRVAGLGALSALPAVLLWPAVADPAAMGVAYLPAILLLALFARSFHQRGHPGADRVSLSSLVLGVAWGLRALDAWSCAFIPVGTHFLWHLLAALGLGLVAQAVLTPAAPPHNPPPTAAPPA